MSLGPAYRWQAGDLLSAPPPPRASPPPSSLSYLWPFSIPSKGLEKELSLNNNKKKTKREHTNLGTVEKLLVYVKHVHSLVFTLKG